MQLIVSPETAVLNINAGKHGRSGYMLPGVDLTNLIYAHSRATGMSWDVGAVSGTVSSFTELEGYCVVTTSVGEYRCVSALAGANKLSFWGATPSGLTSLLNHAKYGAVPVVIDASVDLVSALVHDFEGAVLHCSFTKPIRSDSMLLTFNALGSGSVIEGANFQNITAPWIINRWNSDGDWIATGATTLATLTQSNDEVGYQPTSSDSDIRDSLPAEILNQSICSGLTITNSDGVTLSKPVGRHCAYVFKQCNFSRVLNPDFFAGKHQYGSILFDNTGTTAWGKGNRVIGGRIRYGSVSGVTFMRQRGRSGGAEGTTVYRCGESGFKTYQNEVNGRSARNYQLTFRDLEAIQCFYDGMDTFADYGGVAPGYDRVDDYSVSTYPLAQLPTDHDVRNITCTDCHGTGLTGDGQFTRYHNITVDRSFSSGIFHSGKNCSWRGIEVYNGNRNNAAAGAQMRLTLGPHSVRSVRIRTDSSITAGSSLFSTGAGTSLEGVNLDDTTLPAQPLHPAQQNMYLGRISSTDNACAIVANPRPTILADIGSVTFNISYGVAGEELGDTRIRAAAAGSLVTCMRGDGRGGGFLAGKLMGSYNAGYINNGEWAMYIDGTSIKLVAKLADGTVKTGTLIT